MKKSILFLCIIFFNCYVLLGKTIVGEEAQAMFAGASSVSTNDERGTITQVNWGDSHAFPVDRLSPWLHDFSTRFFPNTEFRLLKEEKDKAGFLHFSYEQLYHQHTIEDAVLKVHIKDGYVYMVNANLFAPSQEVGFVENISLSDAQTIAQKHLMSANIGENQKEVSLQGKVYCVMEGTNFVPCYKFDVYLHSEEPQRSFVYISTKTGAIIQEKNRICHTNVPATAVTKYNGTKTITTDSINAFSYYLRENGQRNIHTLDLNNTAIYSTSVEFLDMDNYWNTTTNQDDAALDVHYATEKTWDYFLNTFGRNSFDNAGTTIQSFVHFGTNYVNAFWDGAKMTYGDGDGVNYGPLTSTDIVGHEITHGITDYTAALSYYGESGALNESFSDIFGVVIDFYANSSTANYLIGDQFALNGQAFRSMANPNLYGQPDTYQGTNWYVGTANNGGVHTNSGVQNYWFYLLCNGGSGSNDLGNSYVVSGIGMSAAAAIAYRTLTVYLTPQSQYADARTYSIQAAIDLFGPCSNQVVQVTRAWYAVGIGANFSNVVTAAFGADAVNFCSAPATVHFSNNSYNATNFLWTFGDGNTSTLANPTHTYTSTGNFTVSLTAIGTGVCNNNNVFTANAYIHVTNTATPLPATCIPLSQNPNAANNGFTRVKIGSIDHSSSDATEGYQDLTCTQSTILYKGGQYLLEIEMATNANLVKVWLDYNNDGILSSSEELFAPYMGGLHYQTIVHIPNTGVATNVPLRLRILSDMTYINDACQNPMYGQAEDYRVTIASSPLPPIADFWMSDTLVFVGNSVQFSDLSANGPTQWKWTINGGNPTQSNAQNCQATFSQVGDYPIKLKASNINGVDSITKTIHVVNGFLICQSNGANTSTGKLYDSGSLGGDYQNGENCTFLIDPGVCTDSIRLSFQAFASENGLDFLKIYAGNTTAAPLLTTVSGTNFPTHITAIATSMLLVWKSDMTISASGFDLNWQAYQHPISGFAVDFSINNNNPALGQQVSFQDLSIGNPSTWYWNFGDGTSAYTQNPTHLYTMPGTYNVQLIASSCGTWDTIYHTLTVQNSPTIVLSPSPLQTGTLACNDTANLTLYVQNTNGGTLNWNLSNQNPMGQARMLVWEYGVDMNPNSSYFNTMSAINQFYPNYLLSTSTALDSSTFAADLIGKNILLLPPNLYGSANVLSLVAPAIRAFVQKGGTLIVCGDWNVKTWQNLGIFTGVSYGTLGNNTSLQIHAINTPITQNINSTVFSSYYTFVDSITNPNKTSILTYQNKDVLTYLPYGLGKAIYFGFSFASYNVNLAQMIANAVEWGANSLANPFWSASPTTGTLQSGGIDTVHVQVISGGGQGGTDTAFVQIQSNDLLQPHITVPIYITTPSVPCAYFELQLGSNCSGLMSFIDHSAHHPTTWHWDLGDGSFSTQQNPVHSYAVSGTYSVTLIVSNSFGADTLTQSVSILNTGGPIPAVCYAYWNMPNSNYYGIKNVSLHTLNHTTSNALEGNKDFTCSQSTVLDAGSQYWLSVKTFSTWANVLAWIDFDNDGILSINEKITFPSANQDSVYTALIQAPISGPSLNQTVRMRVMADENWAYSPCQNLFMGQTEDYSIKVLPANQAPTADFHLANNIVGLGTQLALIDLTQQSPTVWEWTVTGPSSFSSTLQNPIFTFNAPGVYTIKLKASNSYGSDSITKNIQVINGVYLCANGFSSTTTALTGTVYDSGGPNGNFSAYENCSVDIIPTICVDSIRLTFTELNISQGNNQLQIINLANNQMVVDATTISLPFSIVVPSSAIEIYWSCGGIIQSGFAIDWMSYVHPPTPPMANFAASNSNPALLDSVYFMNTSVGASQSWHWDFGDGVTSTLENPFHIYTQPGTYPVQFIATYCAASDTFTQNIVVQASPSIALSPAILSLNMACRDTQSIDLLIHNTSGGTLNWALPNNSTRKTAKMLVWTPGVDLQQGIIDSTMAAIEATVTDFVPTFSSTSDYHTFENLLADKDILLFPYSEWTNAYVAPNFIPIFQAFSARGGTIIVMAGDYVSTWANLGLFSGNVDNPISGGYTLNFSNTSTPITDNLPSIIAGSNMLYPINVSNWNKVTIASINNFGSNYDVITLLPWGEGRAIYLGLDFLHASLQEKKLLGNAVQWAIQTQADEHWSANIDSGSLLAGETDTVNVEINAHQLSGGVDTLFLVVHSNDVNHPLDTFAVVLNISAQLCPEFGFTVQDFCTGKVDFRDSTTNSPTSWSWDFGDNTTSSLQHPTHIYTSTGDYLVKLVVQNLLGKDSITHWVHIENISSPIPALCIPTPNPACYSCGITDVHLGTINHHSGNATEGYQDFTCTQFTTLHQGSQYLLSVNLLNPYEKVKGWIDFNNDGFLALQEQINTTNTTSYLQQSIIQIPSTGVALNTPLRMRLLSDANSNIMSPCYSPYYGQVEDYSVQIVNPPLPPIADFFLSDTLVSVGTYMNLIDLSLNAPTQWKWTINGASIGGGNNQNTNYAFTLAGYYNIQLKASNAYGSDSITKILHVIDGLNLCSIGSAQMIVSPSGTFFDSGGPNGNYSNNENCSLLISPGACTDSIVLDFQSFFVEQWNDYLKVYDGTSANAPLILSATGNTLPPSVTTTSGSVFIQWYSGQFDNYPGFEVHWQAYQHPTTAPIADFTMSSNNPPLMTTVQFTDISTQSPTTWLWNFGDGNGSYQQNPSHSYAFSGTYQVTMIATTCGLSDTISHILTVQDAPHFALNPNSATVNLACNDSVTVNFTIENLSGGDLYWNVENQPITYDGKMLVWTYGLDTVYTYPQMLYSLNQYFTQYTVNTTSATTPATFQAALQGKNILWLPFQELQGNANILPALTPIIQNFVQNGGTLIVSGGYYYNTAVELGIFTSNTNNISSGNLVQDVSNFNTPITQGIPSNWTSYVTAALIGISNPTAQPIITSGGKDVVSYLPMGQGKAIYLAYNYGSSTAVEAKILANIVAWASANTSNADGWNANTQSATLAAGTTGNLAITVNAAGYNGGTYPLSIVLHTNDPNHLTDTLHIIRNVSYIPCAAFDYQTSTCSSIVSFEDKSSNSPTYWLWDFGDGGSATVPNPVHNYTAIGSYQVKLIVGNALGLDTIEQTVHITVLGGAVAANCAPIATFPSSSYGIIEVSFANIWKQTGGASEGYKDFSCTDKTLIQTGEQYYLNVKTPSSFNKVKAWIDFNNDADFDSTELIANFPSGSTAYQAILQIPFSGPVLNTYLRMRVIANDYAIHTACQSLHFGQGEDYSVAIVDTFLSVLSPIERANIQVYPNPFSSELTIDFPTYTGAKNLELRIFNALGQIVYEEKDSYFSESQKNIHLPDTLSVGMYHLEVRVGGKLWTKKIIKE